MGLFDFITSALTPAGTNAAQSQHNQQKQAGNYAFGLLPGASQLAQNAQQFTLGQQPTTQNAVSALGGYTTQAGRDNLTNSYLHQQQGQANSNAAHGLSMFAGNPALQQSYGLDQQNQANTHAAQYSMDLNSPEGLMKAFQAYLAAQQSTQPNYGGLSSLIGAIYGQPAVQVQSNPLAGVLGQAAGSFF